VYYDQNQVIFDYARQEMANPFNLFFKFPSMVSMKKAAAAGLNGLKRPWWHRIIYE